MKKMINVLMLAFLVSCSTDETVYVNELSNEEISAYVACPDTDKVVTMENVQSVAKMFQHPTLQSRSNAEKEIANIHPVYGEDNEIPLFYIINYKNNEGFIIISGSKDYLPVLAYSPTGTFNMDVVGNDGVSDWMNQQKEVLSNVATFPDSLKYNYRSMWEKYTHKMIPYKELAASRSQADVYNFISSSIRNWESEGYTVYMLADFKNTSEFANLPSDVRQQLLTLPSGYANPNYGGVENVSFVLKKATGDYHYKAPLLQTTWNSESGFNANVPDNKPLDCQAVAIGQIMKYHQFPTYINWAGMPNSYSTSATSNFLYNLDLQIDDVYAQGNDILYIYSIRDVFVDYGYTVSDQNHNVSSVLSELNNNRPVCMTGVDGVDVHTWVADGYSYGNESYQYKLMTLEDCPISYEPRMFLNPYTYDLQATYVPTSFHMNWGWGGYCDGYYTDTNLSLSNGSNYSYTRKNIFVSH